MNILYITTYLQGGAGRIVKDLAINQCNKGHKVIVVINNKEEIGYENYNEYIKALEENKIKIYRVDSTFKRDVYLNMQVASQLNQILIDNEIDLIHAHAAVPSMISMISKSNLTKGIPIIQTMHGWGMNKSIDHEKMDVSILNMVDEVITVSNADKCLLRKKGVKSKNILTIYNGIESMEKEPKHDDKIFSDIKKFKENSDILIGCIGSICERKNQKIIIEALQHIKNEKINVAFLGEGSLEIEKLKHMAERFGVSEKIMFLGYVDKAYLYINLFDYLILPSLSEGLGMTILESFQYGVPVIVSNIEVFNEIVYSEKLGIMFDLSDVYDLVGKLKYALEIRRKPEYLEMSKQCKIEFESKYRLEIMYDKYSKEYEEFVN